MDILTSVETGYRLQSGGSVSIAGEAFLFNHRIQIGFGVSLAALKMCYLSGRKVAGM
jgi:hypothetical protein